MQSCNEDNINKDNHLEDEIEMITNDNNVNIIKLEDELIRTKLVLNESKLTLATKEFEIESSAKAQLNLTNQLNNLRNELLTKRDREIMVEDLLRDAQQRNGELEMQMKIDNDKISFLEDLLQNSQQVNVLVKIYIKNLFNVTIFIFLSDMES